MNRYEMAEIVAKAAEKCGSVGLKDKGAIMKKYGINWIRLRIWNNPSHENGGGYTTAERALAMTQRAHELGLKVLIGSHYNDFWADPGKQWAPKAWEKDDAKKVQRDVYDYTKKVLGDFKAAGALPEMVQVGNEITNGMIWPLGKLPSADNGKTLASFVASGLKAVHDTDAGIKTMIHIAIQDQPAVHGAQGRQVYARRLDAGRRPVEVQALCGDRRRGADGRYPEYEVE